MQSNMILFSIYVVPTAATCLAWPGLAWPPSPPPSKCCSITSYGIVGEATACMQQQQHVEAKMYERTYRNSKFQRNEAKLNRCKLSLSYSLLNQKQVKFFLARTRTTLGPVVLYSFLLSVALRLLWTRLWKMCICFFFDLQLFFLLFLSPLSLSLFFLFIP